MSLFGLLITLLILGLIFWLITWIVGMIPLPQPPKTIILVIIGVIMILYLLGILAGAVPYYKVTL